MIKPSRDTYDQHQSSKFLLLCNCNITFSYTVLFLKPFWLVHGVPAWLVIPELSFFRFHQKTKRTTKNRERGVEWYRHWNEWTFKVSNWKDFTYSLIKSYPFLFRRKGWYLLTKNVMPTLAQNIKFLYEKIIYILLINKEYNHKR